MSIRLPALRGDDPLGFLAAVGVVALSEQGQIPGVRLGWEGRSSPVAVVDGEVEDLDELAGALRDAFQRIRDRGEVIPGLGADLPPAPTGTTDPMRMTPEAMAERFKEADRHWHEGNPWVARWLVALAAQGTVKDERRRDVALTPFYAPTGRMALRTSIYEKTVEAVEAVDGPGDALRRWRRVSYDGANFDDRAKRDAGVTTSGKADNQGAPSPTWLASMALRCFPMVDDGREASAVGWQRVRMYPGFTSRSLVWPIWEPMLDDSAVRALLGHPQLQLRRSDGDVEVQGPERLEALGLLAVFGSSRRTLQQGDGPLGPARRLWP